MLMYSDYAKFDQNITKMDMSDDLDDRDRRDSGSSKNTLPTGNDADKIR